MATAAKNQKSFIFTYGETFLSKISTSFRPVDRYLWTESVHRVKLLSEMVVCKQPVFLAVVRIESSNQERPLFYPARLKLLWKFVVYLSKLREIRSFSNFEGIVGILSDYRHENWLQKIRFLRL